MADGRSSREAPAVAAQITREALLAQFATRLEEVRLAAGKPPYAVLQRTGTRIPSSTIGDVLGAKSRPTLDFVLDFVRACHTLARRNGHPIDTALVDERAWRAAWHQLEINLGTLRRQRSRTTSLPVIQSVTGPARRAQPGPRQLPPDISVFTGRSNLLRTLDRVSTRARGPATGTPIVVIEGMAGVGKTTLAVHWAHRMSPHFVDGELFVDLRGFGPDRPVAAEDALAAFLKALGSPGQNSTDLAELTSAYRTIMAERRMLVVLDNAAAAEQVRPLVPASGGSLVVITTRHSLSELAFHEGITRVAVRPMSAGESRQLLVRLVGDRALRAPTEADRISALCGGLPLALRIVAERATLRHHSTLQSLGDVLDDERGDSAGVLAAAGDALSITPGAAFSWSYQALPDPLKPTFRLLGLHPCNEFGLPATAALIGRPPREARQQLDVLASAHLVDEVGTDRYRIHDLLFSYARTMCEEHDPQRWRERAHGRLLSWYLHSAAAADRRMLPMRRQIPLGPAQPCCWPPTFRSYSQSLGWFDDELTNLVAATHLAAAAGDDRTAWKLPFLLLGYFNLRKPWQQWIDVGTVAVDAARRSGDRFGLACSLNGLGIAYRETSSFEPAVTCFEEALAIHREQNDLFGQAMVVGNLGATAHQQGAPHLALARYHRGYSLAQQLDDKKALSNASTNLAEALQELECYDEALVYADRALALCGELGDEAGQGYALVALGQIYVGLGLRHDAIDCFEQARVYSNNVNDSRGVAIALHRLGSYLHSIGRPGQARAKLAEALDIFENLRDPQSAEVRARMNAINK